MSTPTRTPRAPSGAASGPKPPGQRSRTMQLVVIAVAAGLLVVAAVIFFLARGDDGGSSSPSKKSVSGNVQLTLAGIQNANAGAPATFGDDAANQIMAAVGQYVDKGLIAPVKSGKPPTGDVAGLFDAGTQAAIQGPDKDVLFESGKPALTGDFKPAAEPVVITALSDGNGQFVLATAAFTYRADEGVEGGTLTTARTIALTFTPDNGWKITGYDVSLTRQGAQVEGSTTSTVKK
jgi:hypothetical protein